MNEESSVMEKIRFFSDSPADLLPEDTVGAPYTMVPSSVIYDDGRSVYETDIDRDEYYAYLETCKNIPTSAMGSPEQWFDALEAAVKDGYTHALVYTISTTASSVYNSIHLAQAMIEERYPGVLTIEVIDSRQYSMIYGRLLLGTLKQSEQGWSFQQIVEDLKEKTLRNRAVLGAYSLRCMQKSGRVSGMSAFVGGALAIRPTLLAHDGLIEPLEKVRGVKKIVPSIVRHIKSRIIEPADQELMLVHGSVASEELDRLEALLYEEVKPKSIVRHSIGVTVATNCGPETIAVGFFGEPF
jgi:DegV family protein with EDD domain